MPDLTVRIKKKSNGEAALSCLRADGSVTWQRQEGQLGRFFPLHELTHYAVETILGIDRAFYGLVASGWDISSFGGTGAKGRIPHEAQLAEMIVGHFDLERMTGMLETADEVNAGIQAHLEQRRLSPTPFRITDRQMEMIRARRAELFARWNALPAGEAIELPFDRQEQ